MTRPVTNRRWALEKARTSLKRRSSPEWAKAIASIRGRMCRLMVAQIVWFDYFSKKPATPHDATLDDYKNDWEYLVITRAPIRVRSTTLAAALIAVGYAESIAAKRAEVLK
jgi:hypothetical protein